MIKNTLVFIVLVIFISTLAGCGNSDNDNKNQVEDTKTSVEIPSYYPEDLFPIYENAYIESVEKNANRNLVAIGYSNDSVEKVADFYKDLVRNANAKIHSTRDVPNDFIEIGKLGDYTFTIVVTNAKDESGYKTYFNIGLIPDN